VALPGGEEAIHFLTTDAKPAFILLDVAMPGMDGYQLCKIIKAMPKAKDVPVVMLSGDGLVDRVRGRFAGASDFLGKPVNPEAMLKVVRKLADDKA
jgi:CheY-like chemotaxis protein